VLPLYPWPGRFGQDRFAGGLQCSATRMVEFCAARPL